ncbi:P-loop containing nucleoside triphosphate hydrolase protein [Phyllosticta capitalensis]|uniref:P-loop containing nucleoside triphosphate hydrolase protein n=1 Tax=Phyllosticta capitalensis TaxID=121624 RepID=A0ABR1YJ31_9PEZI
MPGFALRTKSWTIINVDNTSALEEPEKVPPANIPQEELKIIKALSDRQMKTKVPWSADFIKNKGKGVVVLLHGPPGVGKTYTVETTAMTTGRPLISLTMADLDDEENIEAELARWFTLANRWKAILLIDEADVFLERRQLRDISRNAIVSAFLRRMEYFEGLLFLTTTRLGFIDEAFISRVHMMIEMKKLSPARRKTIWKNFLDKLARECAGKIRVAPGAVRFILDGPDVCAMDWNGREIRNALQTAIALAEHDAVTSDYHKEGDEIIVESEHFKRVMEMSKSFRRYLDSIGNDSAEERAARLYGRRDRE